MPYIRRPGIDRWTLNRVREWCISRYGLSKFQNDYPTYSLTSALPADMDGEYDHEYNKIVVSRRVKTVRAAVATFIHEYTHYMQNIEDMYDVYYEKYGHKYENHPYEIRARKVAARDVDICMRQLFGRNRS